MKVAAGSAIRELVIKNLLLAHKQVAENGGTKELIILSKFIIGLSKKLDNQLFELRTIENEGCGETPPDKGQ